MAGRLTTEISETTLPCSHCDAVLLLVYVFPAPKGEDFFGKMSTFLPRVGTMGPTLSWSMSAVAAPAWRIARVCRENAAASGP